MSHRLGIFKFKRIAIVKLCSLCSGYVSWVVNHTGWNFGRLTADGLLGVCTPVTSANAKPGDLIFFQGTYNTSGASHVGIYVGGGMMIHCGDPISYARRCHQSGRFCKGKGNGMLLP